MSTKPAQASQGTIKIRRWDWDKQNFSSEPYPAEMFEDFLDWLFTTKRWIEEPQRVQARVLQLERDMAAHRNPPDTHHEENSDPVAIRKAELAHTRRMNLQKAREAKAANDRQRQLEKEGSHAG